MQQGAADPVEMDLLQELMEVLENDEGGPSHTDAPSGSLEAEVNGCWGAALKGCSAGCKPNFTSGKNHFKNKFCDRCREGIDVPAARVRALTNEQADQVFNNLASGFWKRAPASMGGCMVRVANQTHSCIGPVLCVFKDAPPPVQFAALPSDWTSDGFVRLCVSKGTLVPAPSVSRRRWLSYAPSIGSKRQRRRGDVAEQLSSASSGEVAVSVMHHSSDGSEMADAESTVAEMIPERAADFGAAAPIGNGPSASAVASVVPVSVVAPQLGSDLATTHAAVITQIESFLGKADPALIAPPVYAILQRQLLQARVALLEAQWLSKQAAPESVEPGAALSPSRQSLRSTSSITWSNFATVSDMLPENVVKEDSQHSSPSWWEPPAHYSTRLRPLHRAQSDAGLNSRRVRAQSLSTMLRRLFIGGSSPPTAAGPAAQSTSWA